MTAWCLNKAKEAMKNYDQPSALNYLAMAELWLSRKL